MVRITLYDPKISAEVYSRRRAAEQPFESPIAEGLGQLGRAITQREERREAGHQDKTQAMRVLAKMRRTEFARLKKEGQAASPESRWAARGYVLEYLSRRDETITDLATRNPRAAQIVADESAALTEDVSRRAMVVESASTGDALAADITAVVGDAIETVRIDPIQLQGVLSEFRTTLTGLVENGMDPNAIATIIGAAERNITNAAFRQRLEEDPEAAREELEAGEFGDAMPPEETEALTARADQAVKVQRLRAEADTKAADDDYRAGFDDYLARWMTGDVEEDDAFAEGALRARVSPETFEHYFLPRLRRATAIADVFSEIEFLSDTEIRERIIRARPSEAEVLTDAQALRNRVRDEDPAAFALRNSAVLEMRNAWMHARAEGDFAAAAVFGRKYVVQTLGRQRGMGVAESDLRLLPDDMAEAMVENFTRHDGEGAFAWGEHFRTEFGENWRVAVVDVVRAGLPETHAALAQMSRLGQRQAAAQIEAALSETGGLGRSGGEAAAAVDEAIDTILLDVRGQAGTELIDRDSSQANIARWRADQLVGIGMAPEAAARQALRELALTPGQYLWIEGPARETGPGQVRFDARVAETAILYGFDPEQTRAGGSEVQGILLEFDRGTISFPGEYERVRGSILELDFRNPMRTPLLETLDGIVRGGTGSGEPERTDAAGVDGPSAGSALESEYTRLVADMNPQQRARGFREGLLGLNLDWASGELNQGDVAFLNEALSGDDPMRLQFGATAILRAVEEGHSVFGHISDDARSAYLDFVVQRYHATAPIDLGSPLPSDDRLRGMAAEQRFEFGIGADAEIVMPAEISEEVVLHLSRLPRASREQAQAYEQFIRQVVPPYSQELADRLLEAAQAMAVEPGTISIVPGGELVVDPGGLGDVHGRYSPYMTDEDLALSFMARSDLVFPDLSMWPRGVPGDLLDTDFAVSAGFAVATIVRTAVSKPAGPWSAILAAAGIARSGKGLYDRVDDDSQEHSDYLLSVELVRRSNDEAFRDNFRAVWNIAKASVGDSDMPERTSSAAAKADD